MNTKLSAAAAAMGRKGGLARARKLTKAERVASCRKAGLASARARKRKQQEAKL